MSNTNVQCWLRANRPAGSTEHYSRRQMWTLTSSPSPRMSTRFALLITGSDLLWMKMASIRKLASGRLCRRMLASNEIQHVAKRFHTDDLQYQAQAQERARSVTSFYNQSAIDAAAAKVSHLHYVDSVSTSFVFSSSGLSLYVVAFITSYITHLLCMNKFM